MFPTTNRLGAPRFEQADKAPHPPEPGASSHSKPATPAQPIPAREGPPPLKRLRADHAPDTPVAARARMARLPSEWTTRDVAAQTLVRGLRRRVADLSFDRMFLKGTMWADYQEALTAQGLLPSDEPLTIGRLSSINLTSLRRRLERLDDEETKFLDRFTRQQFFATHFTDAALDHAAASGEQLLAIFSRDKLVERGIAFDTAHTSEGDLSLKGDSDCVFFALECTPKPAKLSSRFGATVYRVPFESSVFQQTAWASLDDLLGAQDKNAADLMPGLPALNADERAGFSAISERANRDFSEAGACDDIFSGKDLLSGAGLTLIDRLRTLRATPGCESLADRFLASDDPAALNTMLNGILRPEIRVPRHFFATHFENAT